VPEAIGIDEAQRLVLERAKRLDLERVPVERAYGRVLGETATAASDLPPFASSAMDGFAVRTADAGGGGIRLTLAGRIAAGSPAPAPLAPGQAMAIATGGAVPEGADAVVPLELVREADGAIELDGPVETGANIRRRGGDVAAGAPVLEPGTRVGPAQVGALTAAGITELRCAKRPRVGVLVTGSELRQPGEPLGPGQIYESNGAMLAALLNSAGAVPAQLGVVPDDEEAHRTTMERALLGFDMLVTTGGASVGPHDLVRRVLADLRVEEVFWRVAIKPGRPVAFGVRRDHLVFTLPGNPVSALVCFELLVRPAVNALLGLSSPLPERWRGVLAESVRRGAERDEFLRATRETSGDGEVVLRPVGGQDSHMIVSAAQADALVHVPRGDGELPAGSPVDFLLLG
jgi:molybdopterin molybdotransferase